MLEKIKNNRFFQYFALGLFAMLIFWGGLLRKNFCPDTLTYIIDPETGWYSWVQDARFVSAILHSVLKKFGLTFASNLSITMLFALVICAFTIATMAIIFEEWLTDSFQSRMGMFIGIVFVFSTGLFSGNWMFSETSFSFALTYFCSAVAAYMLKQKKYICMVIFLVLGICTYQNAVPFFVLLSLFIIYYQGNKTITFYTVRKSFIVTIVAFLLGYLNLTSIRIMGRLGIIDEAKKSTIGNWSEKLKQAFTSLAALYTDGDGFLPNVFLPLLITLVIMGTITYICIRQQQYNILIYNWVLFIVSHIVIYIIPLAMSQFSFPYRLSFVFFLIQGLMYLNILDMLTEKSVAVYCGVVYLVIHLLFCGFIISNHFVSNSLDDVYAHMIINKIEKYEVINNIKIQKLAVCTDSYAPNTYGQVHYKNHEVNERSLRVVPRTTLEYFTGRVFEYIDMPSDVQEKYFAGKDWEYFDVEEQVIIEGDTAYWCIF